MGDRLNASRNGLIGSTSDRALSELTVLRELGKVVTSTLKLDDLLKSVLVTGSKVLGAKGGVVRLEDRKNGELKVRCSLGEFDKTPLDERVARRVLFTRRPMSLRQMTDQDRPVSILCAPLLSNGKSFGTLAFYDLEADPSTFDERDLQFLTTTANQVSSSIENALTHCEVSEIAQKEHKRVRQLSTLWELNKTLLTTVNFERILEMTLTAITIGDGLGFNRAMLFLIDEKSKTLKGFMAVGPSSAEEAGRIWNDLSRRREPLSDLIQQIQPPAGSDSLLNSVVKGTEIPLDLDPCILSGTVREGRSFNITLPRDGEGKDPVRCGRGCPLSSGPKCLVGEQLGRGPGVYSFATVPLWGKGRVIGVILVDNFYNQNPITEEDLHFLAMFSNQAGLAIENALLYRKLEEIHQQLKETQTLSVHREKIEALEELAAAVAHEIKNPLVSIGGFTRRLNRAISDGVPEKGYALTIIKEVSRLERFLDDILAYTHREPLLFEPLDARGVLEDSLSMIVEGFDDGGVQLVKEFAEDLPKVIGNPQQLKQAFFNLIDNAYQAMNGKGVLSIRAYPDSTGGSSCVKVEIGDTGNGIDPENLHHIFNPFYSTKPSSLGLGLPIVHKIVTSHRGRIEVSNRSGKGVTFIVTLLADGPKGEDKGSVGVSEVER
jgi:two-component system, NtrC family, sensor histidine kinase HydH